MSTCGGSHPHCRHIKDLLQRELPRLKSPPSLPKDNLSTQQPTPCVAATTETTMAAVAMDAVAMEAWAVAMEAMAMEA